MQFPLGCVQVIIQYSSTATKNAGTVPQLQLPCCAYSSRQTESETVLRRRCNWTCKDPLALWPYLLFVQPREKTLYVVCFNSVSSFISVREKPKDAGIHVITQEVFGSGNGLVSHKLWTSLPWQSQRRYQSVVFALARTQAANARCEKQGSKSHTDGEPCLSVARSLW